MLHETDPESNESLAAPLPPPVDYLTGSTPKSASQWKDTLDQVIKSVVSLHYAHLRSFDVQPESNARATGFVVDRERGYILTNRHVVGPGPFWGYCTFSNHEECDVQVAYYDPIHDFAFLKYNPAAIKHADIVALELRPQAAQVGVEVRVVGNDSGEVLSIASAVISRLDRNAPEYSGHYSDFNTNYIQASAASKGGSSGSPVVNVDGYAVALQAGGKTDSSTTNYFLPLQRVSRALHLLQQNKPITRGTVQTVWTLESFDICKRLGLPPEEESMLRKMVPGVHSMLVVDQVLPNGRAHGKLEKGDLLLAVNNEVVMTFNKLEEILDAHVGESLAVQVRRGDKKLDVKTNIQDLYDITPRRFIIAGDAHFNDISHILARSLGVACKGVYCPENGTLWHLPSGAVVDSVDNIPTPNLKTFTEVIRRVNDKDNVKFTYRNISDLHTKMTAFVSLSTLEHPKLELWSRDDDYARWTLQELDYEFGVPSPKSKIGSFPAIEGLTNKNAAYITSTIAFVSCSVPTFVSGIIQAQRTGYGLVVDAQQGILLVSRTIVPQGICQISAQIANVEVPAKLLFLHPIHGYALLKYDPSIVQAAVQSVRLSDVPAKPNSPVTLIAVQESDGNRLVTDTTINDISNCNVAVSAIQPRYRAFNLDAVYVESRMMYNNELGVMVDSDGLAVAILLEFQGPPASDENNPGASEWHKFGLHASDLYPVIERIKKGEQKVARVLDAEMVRCNIVTARNYGVDEKWIEQLTQESRRQVFFRVRAITCPPPEENFDGDDHLLEDDIVLTVDGKLVTDTKPFGILYDKHYVPATIVRAGQEMAIKVPTVSIEHLETNKAILFQGAILHKPHFAVRQALSELPSEIYVSGVERGSPAGLYGVWPVRFITHVNDTETPDLDAFLKAAEQVPDNTFFRLRMMTHTLVPAMVTMKKCDYYFPLKILEVQDGAVTCVGGNEVATLNGVK